MSLSHLGKESGPVFDALLPANDEMFPVARRVVSHAARSLFAGKLLFPVATAGKEGQHCFSDTPERLFRFSPRRNSPPASIQSSIHRTFLSFHTADPVRETPGARILMPAHKLESASRNHLHVPPGRFDLDCSLRHRDFAGLKRPLLRGNDTFFPPRLILQLLLSRYEVARLRRLSADSEGEALALSVSSHPAASVLPSAWDLHAWPLKEAPERHLFKSKYFTPPLLSAPGPALMTPLIPSASGKMVPAATFRTTLSRCRLDWHPVPGFRIKPQSFPSSPRRSLIHDLLDKLPRFAPIDREYSIPFILYPGPWTVFHAASSCFGHASRHLRPNVHSQTLPGYASVKTLPQPDKVPPAVCSIIATISRSRLARVEGQPRERMFRAWPKKAFSVLRRLHFNPSGFRSHLFAEPRDVPFISLTSSVSVSIHDVPEERIPSRPVSLLDSWRSDDHPFSKSIFGKSGIVPALSAEGFSEKTASPATFIFSPPLPAPMILLETLFRSRNDLPIARPLRPGSSCRGRFQNSGFSRMPRQLSDSGYTPPARCAETRQPVNPMVLLASGKATRGPRPLIPPRRLPQPLFHVWITLAGSSLPRRTAAMQQYLLTLSSLSAAWKQHPQSRGTRFSTDRHILPVNRLEPSAHLLIPASFTSGNPLYADDIRIIAGKPTRALLPERIYSIANTIRCDRSLFQVSPVSPPAHVSGVIFSETPEWARPGRQVKMKVRYWPTFSDLSPVSHSPHVSFRDVPR